MGIETKYDVVNGVRICRLRPSMLAKQQPTDVLGCFLWMALAIALLLACSYFTIRAILDGNDTPLFIFMFLLVFAFVAAMMLGFYETWKRMRAPEAPFPQPIQDVGERLRDRADLRAKLCSVSAYFGQGATSAIGWIWFDNGWMRFRGDRFDFDLTREQATLLIGPEWLTATVELPAGLGKHQLSIQTTWTGRKVIEEQMGPSIKTFNEGLIGDGEALLASLHRDPPIAPLGTLLAFGALVAIPFPIIVEIARSLIPDMADRLAPSLSGATFAGLFGTTALMFLPSHYFARRSNRKVDTAISASNEA